MSNGTVTHNGIKYKNGVRAEWVLWGRHPSYASGSIIKLVGGSLSKCERERKSRFMEGFNALQIIRPGEAPADK